MLQIRDVCKEYHTGTYSQKALDHISLSLRDNEFVAILGPSGSGKTTLLNIVGGLDRYDSGDLIINGTSTKEYKDRDWDAYRNHSIGFIFQSYNLIPHQTILANVELALTIAGISKKERTRRAKEALGRVGLGDHINKLPNQLSGGQMQRVAIARALINEPTVLLADEPTGALDSETSIQVMELLKEVAKDRLVVMVTHNPELAKTYANRIVELRDGQITSDTNPFSPEEATAADHRRLGKASMSFFTALGLSFMNLKTKLSRTLLVSFAGSIGIIGIALILALSTGTNTYIEQVQRETLSEYPIRLQERTIDLSSLLSERQEASQTSDVSDDRVTEAQRLKSLFATAESNDLGSFMEYLEDHTEETGKLARSVEYIYSVTPLIFSEQKGRTVQVNPSKAFSALGISSSLFSYSSMIDAFGLMPDEPSLYEDQYDVKAGRWPKDYHEIVLVLSPNGTIGDLTLYAMGLKDYSLLEQMIADFLAGIKVESGKSEATYAYEDFIGITFRLVNRADLFAYDEARGLWTDRSEDEAYVKSLVETGEELKIVGVVKPKEGASATMLGTGMNYLPSLILHVIEEAANSAPVQAQLADPSVNLLTGRRFDEEGGSALSSLASIFSIDPEAIQNAFSFDADALELDFSELKDLDLDLSGVLDPNELSSLLPELSLQEILALLGSVKFDLSPEKRNALVSSILSAYYEYASSDPSTDYTRLPEAMRAYLNSDEAKELLSDEIAQILDENSAKAITPERIKETVDRILSHFSEYVVEESGTALDELIDRYSAGEIELSDLVELLVELIPSYLQTDEATLLIEEEIDALRSELLPRLISREQISRLFTALQNGYEEYAEEEGLPQTSQILDSFAAFLATEEGSRLLSEGLSEIVDTSGLEEQVAIILEAHSKELEASVSTIVERLLSQVMQKVSKTLSKNLESLPEKLMEAFSIDSEAFAGAIKINMDDTELKSLISSLMSGDTSTYESNLSRFGYADISQPDEIIIYPKNFDTKAELISMIDSYNDDARAAGNEEKVIHYSDLVGTMMNSVTDIVNAISYILIAFVSVSLIVSSIMIGVITYISVLERKKEIGILRAIGASKHNVASVFNAETFIIGALSGVLGVAIAGLLLIPINILIHHLSGQSDLNGFIPIPAALLLILLSIVLTLIGGLIPSRSAAKSDPVTALRTE